MLTVTYDNWRLETSYTEELGDFLDKVNHPANLEDYRECPGLIFESGEDHHRRQLTTLLRFTANLTEQLVKSGAIAPEGVAEALEDLTNYARNLSVVDHPEQ